MRVLLLSSLSLLSCQSVMGACGEDSNAYADTSNGGACTPYTFTVGKALSAVGTDTADYQWEDVSNKMLTSDGTWVAASGIRTDVNAWSPISAVSVQKAWYANKFCSEDTDGSVNSPVASSNPVAAPKTAASIGKVLKTTITCVPEVVTDTLVAGTNTPGTPGYITKEECEDYKIAIDDPVYTYFAELNSPGYPKGCIRYNVGDGLAFYWNKYDDDVNGINDDPNNPGDPAANCNAHPTAPRQCIQDVCAAGGGADDALWYDIPVGEVVKAADGSSVQSITCPVGSVYRNDDCTTAKADLEDIGCNSL